MRSYREWVKYYLQLSGLSHVEPVFTSRIHPSFCAWVSSAVPGFEPSPNQIVFGLSYPDENCFLNAPTKALALHEVCHVRMQHLEPDVHRSLSGKQRHQEVAQCMKWYQERERFSDAPRP